MYSIAWHQVFSNYRTVGFRPNARRDTITIRRNLGGRALRLELSNAHDTEELLIEGMRVAVDERREPVGAVTLGGRARFPVPAGQTVWTDALEVALPERGEVRIDIEASNASNLLCSSAHTYSDRVFSTTVGEFGTNFVYGVTSLAIDTDRPARTVGFFGDSLTNQGYYVDQAILDLYDAHPHTSALNEGISGNRLLREGTSESAWSEGFGAAGVRRFSSLVGYRPDIAVILMGLNDLYQVDEEAAPEGLPSSPELIGALRRMVNEAAAANIRPVLVTWTPFKGALSHEREAWSEGKEGVRQRVNRWIRTQPHAVDLDAFARSRRDARRLDSRFDSGDHLHFSRDGGALIGDFVFSALEGLL